MKGLFKIVLLTIVMLINTGVTAGVEVQQFETAEQQQRYKKLVDELRCLVCQNQNLAGSNAELAQDLRKKVAEMIIKDRTDDQVIEYMVARYGDFVLYRPPFKASTFLLWTGPFLILIAAMMIAVFFIRRQKNQQLTDVSDELQEKARQLLDQQKDKD